MSLIVCSECGGKVSDKAKTCPHCGAPVEVSSVEVEMNNVEDIAPAEDVQEIIIDSEAEKKPKSKKKIAIILGAIAVIVVLLIILIAITADREPPVISGIDKDTKIDIQCGTDANLKDYLNEKISITDNKDGEITDYTVSANKEIYNKKTGKINTQESGEYKVRIIAEDEAGNTAEKECTLSLNPIHISKDNKTPVVYDGEYGKIKVVSFKHGFIDGIDQYNLILDFTNAYDKELEVYLSSQTYINDRRVGAYYTLYSSVKPGKKGEAECSIYDEDIPKDIGDYSQIESSVGIMRPGADKSLYHIPIIMDVDVAE